MAVANLGEASARTHTLLGARDPTSVASLPAGRGEYKVEEGAQSPLELAAGSSQAASRISGAQGGKTKRVSLLDVATW